MIRNVHTRKVDASPDQVGALMNTLSSPDDRLWPHDRWPRMFFDRPLQVGAVGGHGPIRYSVSEFEPGKSVVFTFDPKIGLKGTHRIVLAKADDGGTVVRHELDAESLGSMRVLWPLAVRWMHDAVVEDALDHAEAFANQRPVAHSPYKKRVRLMRALERRLVRKR
jgi:hypothetical protein